MVADRVGDHQPPNLEIPSRQCFRHQHTNLLSRWMYLQCRSRNLLNYATPRACSTWRMGRERRLQNVEAAARPRCRRLRMRLRAKKSLSRPLRFTETKGQCFTNVRWAFGSRLVEYCTFVVGEIAYDQTEDRSKKGLTRYPVPVIVVTPLSVASASQGNGICAGLLKDAILRVSAKLKCPLSV